MNKRVLILVCVIVAVICLLSVGLFVAEDGKRRDIIDEIHAAKSELRYVESQCEGNGGACEEAVALERRIDGLEIQRLHVRRLSTSYMVVALVIPVLPVIIFFVAEAIRDRSRRKR